MPLTRALPGAGMRRAPATQEEFAKSRCTGFERTGQQVTGACTPEGQSSRERVGDLHHPPRWGAACWGRGQPVKGGIDRCVLIGWESRSAPLQPGSCHGPGCWGTGGSRADTASQQVHEKGDVCTSPLIAVAEGQNQAWVWGPILGEKCQ